MAPRRKTFCLWLITGVLVPIWVAGQDGYPVQPVGILDIGGDITITGHLLERKSLTGPAGTETREQEKFFVEKLSLEPRGYFYHPNLIDWDASLRFGLQQQRIRINDLDFDADGTITGYNLSALILKEKWISLRPFASDSRDVLDRDFSRRVQQDRRWYGIDILAKGRFPTVLTIENLQLSEISDLREDDRQTRRLRLSISDQRDRDWYTAFVYEHEDTAQTSVFFPPGGGPSITRDLPVTRDEVNISSLWRFGSMPQKSSLSGTTRFLNRGGFFPNNVLSINQRLNLVHSDTFSTFYRMLYSRDRTEIDKDDVINGEIGFTKRIYDSLDITGRLGYIDRSFKDGSEDTVRGFLDMQYRKSTPVGQYTSSVLLGKQFEEEKSGGGQRLIRDEAVTLTGIGFFALSEPNVVAGTILVTDGANAIVYVESLDYTLRTIGAFTEIARLPGGTITDPQTVLVDYRVLVARAGNFTTDHITWTNRLRLAHLPLSLYADYRVRDQQLRSGDDPGNLDRRIDGLMGVELDFKGLNASLEHEVMDQELSPPFTADRVRLSYRRQLQRNLNLTLGGYTEKRDYRNADQFGLDPGRDSQDTNSAYAHLVAKLSPNALVRFTGDHSQTKGLTNSRRTRFEIAFEYTLRNLDLWVKAGHDISEVEQNERTGNFLRFEVKRDF